MAYYQRIRDLREDSDKNQSEIAEYLGTSTQYYGMYERGLTEIPFERAIALAKYYSVSLDYIAGLTNDKRGLYADCHASRLTEKQEKALDAFMALVSSDNKEKKEHFINAVAELLRLL